MKRQALLLLAVACVAAAQDGPPALTPGASVKGTTRKDAPAVWALDVKSAGVVTLAVTAEGQADLVVALCDEEGQLLPDWLDPTGQLAPGARSDLDLLGERGVEVLTALAPAPGRYLVAVEAVEGEGRFSLAAAFAPAPALARPADADDRPSKATAFDAGPQPRQLEDTLEPREHDPRDWFAVKATRAGTLSVVARAAEGDLRLDAFAPGDARHAVEQSDDDEQGVAGHESVAVPVREGQVVLVRVSAVFLQTDRIAYRLLAAVVAQ